MNQLRLKYAVRQLIETDTPIEAIAAECGFASRTYFYRIFEDAYHLTPREYRLQNTATYPVWTRRPTT